MLRALRSVVSKYENAIPFSSFAIQFVNQLRYDEEVWWIDHLYLESSDDISSVKVTLGDYCSDLALKNGKSVKSYLPVTINRGFPRGPTTISFTGSGSNRGSVHVTKAVVCIKYGKYHSSG